MRETMRDLKDVWIQTFGVADGLEVAIVESNLVEMSAHMYEGGFAQIPDQLLVYKVIRCDKIDERNDVYLLTV